VSSELPRPVAALLRRLTELNERDQLAAYEAIRDYLAAGGKVIAFDEELDARASAVSALRAVADYLGVDVAELQFKQFDAAPEELRGGWRGGQVINAFDTWRFARETAAGRRARPTARQRALLSASGARRLQRDDYLAGVRAWLETDPPKLGAREYNDWRREHNKTLAEGELPYPAYYAIHALGLSWKTILKVARGEVTLDKAQRSELKQRHSRATGPHDLVTTLDIRALTGSPPGTVQFWSYKADFPTPVLIIGDRRYWLREDIEAFFSKKPFPKRTLNELRGLYVNRNEAAAILGVQPGSVKKLKGRPEPVFEGMNRLWLRAEIEEFRDQRECPARSRERQKGK
jgi:hypothetical protein